MAPEIRKALKRHCHNVTLITSILGKVGSYLIQYSAENLNPFSIQVRIVADVKSIKVDVVNFGVILRTNFRK